MRIKLFTFRYSATLGGFDDGPLQTFARDKELLSFREHFFTVNDTPHLACVLTWQDAVVAGADLEAALDLARTAARDPEREPIPPGRERPPRRRSRSTEDVTAGLDEPRRALFNTLREWRARKAHEQGVPPFLVFTNRQLVEMVTRRPASPNALGHLHGIGPGKLARYGAEVLALLAQAPAQPAEVEASS